MNGSLGRVLVADDEADLRALLHRYLGDQGFFVRTVENAAHAERLLRREHFDVLVLDIMMPGEDGLAACRRLRAHGETIPILMLTARGEPMDRILGLEIGADDYLAKPFNPRELAARIQALVRRQRVLGAHHAPAASEQAEIRFGPFVLRPAQRVLLRGDREVPLSTAEFLLLRALAQQPRRPLGRERLLQLAYGPGHAATERSIDVQIMRLRKLVEDDPTQPRRIRTVWGLGYEFVPDVGLS